MDMPGRQRRPSLGEGKTSRRAPRNLSIDTSSPEPSHVGSSPDSTSDLATPHGSRFHLDSSISTPGSGSRAGTAHGLSSHEGGGRRFLSDVPGRQRRPSLGEGTPTRRAFRNLSIDTSSPEPSPAASSPDSTSDWAKPHSSRYFRDPSISAPGAQTGNSPERSSHGSRFYRDSSISTPGSGFESRRRLVPQSRSLSPEQEYAKAGAAQWLALHEKKGGRLFLSADGGLHPSQRGKQPHGGFARRRPVHPVLAIRYKWRTACEIARKTDTPEKSFMAVLQLRSTALRPPVKCDSIRPVSTCSALRPSTSSAVRPTNLRGGASTKAAPHPRVVDAPPTPLNISPTDAASMPRSWAHDTLLSNASRAQRDFLLPPMRLSEQMPSLQQSRLPGPLRCARAHAPRFRRVATSPHEEEDELDFPCAATRSVSGL